MCIRDRLGYIFFDTRTQRFDDRDGVVNGLIAAGVLIRHSLYGSIAVSYTHLDVYKRQVQNSSLRDGLGVDFDAVPAALAGFKPASAELLRAQVAAYWRCLLYTSPGIALESRIPPGISYRAIHREVHVA